MKRLIVTESEKKEILKLYGLISEQKYMQSYPGNLLDQCGYRAIEQFEETMGTPQGTSMGNDYFENEIARYEQLISTNLNNTISTPIFQKLPSKLRMQIWSFMFNTTDASQGTVKWLAGLGQAMGLNQNSSAKNEQEYRIRVMAKNTQEYSDAINNIKNFKGSWDNVYRNYLSVLDQQYQSTAASNKKQGSYDNSWKYRPTKLDEFYNNCGSSSSAQKQTTQQTQSNQQKQTTTPAQTSNAPINFKVTEGGLKGYDEFAKQIKEKTKNSSIDWDSINLDFKNRTFSVNPGNQKIGVVSLVMGRDADGKSMDDNFENRIESIYRANESTYEITEYGSPSVCNDCLIEGGKKIPIKYQLLVLIPIS